MSLTTRLQVSVAEESYKETVRRRLADSGWKHVSSQRDSFSGWSKPLPDGVLLLAQESLALAIQGYMEEQDELSQIRWICSKCTTVNGVENQACLGCKADKPASPQPAVVSKSFEDIRQHIQFKDDGSIFVKAEFTGGAAVDEWVRLAVDWFRQHSGHNYVSMDLTDFRDGQAYTFTVQRQDGRTPSQSIAELSAEQPRIANRILRTLEKLHEFYTADQAITWLEQHHRDLQNRRPIDVLLTQEGSHEVTAILARMADGAHS